MRKLTEYLAYLISDAYNTLGNNENAYYYIEERLRMNQLDPVYDFMAWIYDNDKGYTAEKGPQLFQEFLKQRN